MTLEQALTWATFFASFAIHAQAASKIVDGELSERELCRYGKPSSFRHILDDRTGYSTLQSILGYDAKAIYAHTDTFPLYLVLMPSLSANTTHGIFGVRLQNHGPCIRKLGQYNLALRGSPRPASSEIWMPIGYICQLLSSSKPLTHMGDHKNRDDHIIGASMPPLRFVDFAAQHRTMKHTRDKNPADPIFITIPEPTSLALLVLGFLAMTAMLLQNENPLLSAPLTRPVAQNTEAKSRFSSARLLRRDLRNNILLFKFLHQRKYNIL